MVSEEVMPKYQGVSHRKIQRVTYPMQMPNSTVPKLIVSHNAIRLIHLLG